MKKLLTLQFVCSFQCTLAGTGGANDEHLLILSFVAVMVSILFILYSVDFIRKKIVERKEKGTEQLPDETNSENID